MIVLGFDPGTTGAGAIIGAPAGPLVFDLPTVPIPGEGKTRRRVDPRGLYKTLLQHLDGAADVFAIKEGLAVGGFGKGRGSNASSNGSQIASHECIQTTIELMGLEITDVYPVTWKKLYGLGGKSDGESANRAREIAKSLYPDLEHELRLVGHHNRAEALLIAHWYRRELMNAGRRANLKDPFAA